MRRKSSSLIVFGLAAGGLISPQASLAAFNDSGQALGSGTSVDIVAADFTGDGHVDIVSANYGAPDALWINDGNGQFSDSGQGIGPGFTTAVAALDVDGDGDLDLILGSAYNDDELWLNDGTGQFTDSGTRLDGNWNSDLVIGDIDGDGWPDVVDATYSGSPPDTVWLNDGSGGFPATASQALPAEATVSAALGDFDGDGDPDLVTMQAGATNAHTIFRNDGGSFTGPTQTLASRGGNGGIGGMETVDIDMDGDIDIVSDSHVLENDGSGGFTVLEDWGTARYDVAIGDLDGDGSPDVVRTGSPGEVWLNDGSGNLADSGQPFGGSAEPRAIALADVDGDGDLDILTAVFDAPNRVYLNSAIDGTASARAIPSLSAWGLLALTALVPLVATRGRRKT